MDSTLSNKIRFISFASILMVVLLHSYNLSYWYELSDPHRQVLNSVSLFVEVVFTEGITRIAVPLLFTLSGFLFFYTLDFSFAGFVSKFRRRIRSLVFPYLIVSVLWLATGLFLYQFKTTLALFNKDLTAFSSLSGFLYSLFVRPFAYHLWYIRDLIILVFFSPLIGFLTYKTKGLWLVFLLSLWFTDWVTFDVPKTESLLFFSVGCFLASAPQPVIAKKIILKSACLLCFIWIVLILIKTSVIGVVGMNTLRSIHKMSILSGMLTLWYSYDYFPDKIRLPFYKLASYSFFIYLVHEPLLSIFKKLLFSFTGPAQWASMLNYFAAPFVTVIASLVVARLMIKHTPLIYKILSGGR
ncbi:MAG: acyltransferase [Bacteroidia bacterium]|nr:acyltransferase [Bacteroidia bacterium]